MIIKDGREYARVSEILAPLNDFSHIDPEVLANKCRIGTRVHEAIAAEIAGEFPILDEASYGYFKSFLAWNQELKPHFRNSEQRYYSDEHMITGQIDSLIHFDGKGPYLVDFKTSASEGDTWIYQGHLYHMLLAENKISLYPRYLFIKLDKNGMLPRIFEYRLDLNIRAQCVNAIRTYWKNKENEKK